MKYLLNSIKHSFIIIIPSLLVLSLMLSVRLSGDENYYYRSSIEVFRYIFNIVDYLDIVENGWFMPGMAFVIFPLQTIYDGDAPLGAVRLYVYIINISLIIYINWKLFISKGNYLGSYIAQSIMVLNLYYLVAITTIWSELLALHLALATLLSVGDLRKRLGPYSLILALGVISFCLASIRAIYLAFPLFVIVMFIIQDWKSWRSTLQNMPQNLVVLALASAVMMSLLIPWSMAVTAKIGPTLTVSSQYMSRIVWLGDQEYVAQQVAPEARNQNPFFLVHGYISERADENNVTYLDQAKVEFEAATDGVEFSRKIKNNISSFFALNKYQAAGFTQRFIVSYCANEDNCIFNDSTVKLISVYMQYIWYLTLSIGVFVFLLPYGYQKERLYNAFLFKGLVALVCLHPLMVMAHARYYSQLIPLIALAIGCFKLSDARLFFAQIRNPQQVTLIELGQFVSWLAVLAITLVWLTGVNPLL